MNFKNIENHLKSTYVLCTNIFTTLVFFVFNAFLSYDHFLSLLLFQFEIQIRREERNVDFLVSTQVSWRRRPVHNTNTSKKGMEQEVEKG